MNSTEDADFEAREESEAEMERQRAHAVPSNFKVEATVEGHSPANLDHKQGGSYSESRSFRNAWGNESYATIITNAINSAPSKKMKLSNIYHFFESKFEYFAHNKDKKGWKNSVRHNLSLGKQFKRHQSADPKEKGSFWYVDDTSANDASSSTPRSSSFSASGCRKKSAQINGGGRASRARSENSILANAVDNKTYSGAAHTPGTLMSQSPAPSLFPVNSQDNLQMELTTNNHNNNNINNNFSWMEEPINSWSCHRQRAQTTGAIITRDPVFPSQQPTNHFLNALHPLPPLSMEMSNVSIVSPPITTQTSQIASRPSNLPSFAFSAEAAWRNPVFESSYLNRPPERLELGQSHPPPPTPPTGVPFADFHSNFASPPPQINTLPSVNDLNIPIIRHHDPGDFSTGFQNLRLDRSNLAPINAFCASSYECSDIGQIHPTINELICDNPLLITSSQ